MTEKELHDFMEREVHAFIPRDDPGKKQLMHEALAVLMSPSRRLDFIKTVSGITMMVNQSPLSDEIREKVMQGACELLVATGAITKLVLEHKMIIK